MARRITYRLLIFGFLILVLVVLIAHSSSYGLSREAQYESLRKKMGGWKGGAGAGLGAGREKGAQKAVDDRLAVIAPSEAPSPSPVPPPAAPAPSTPSSTPTAPPTASSPPSLELLPPKNYTRALVIARTTAELALTSWLTSPALVGDPLLKIHPYTVDAISTLPPPQGDNPNNDDDTSHPITTTTTTLTALTVPANKGHEAMPYLTYIITSYSSPSLADISLFMHAHRYTWHNNDLLSSDALETITRLSSPTVTRHGYFNLRCHLDPGCPAHLHPATTSTNINQPEEREIGAAWAHLFPGEPVPSVLSQPCCSQFALSADKIRSIPLSTYTRLRQWLLDTPLNDALAGRVFEYVWQKLWLGLDEHCPSEHVCYCDGYGVCFEDEAEYARWFEMRNEWRVLAPEMGKLEEKDKSEPGRGWLEGARAVELKQRMVGLRRELDEMRRVAFLRGNSAEVRARVAGRAWRAGDGF